MKEQTGVNARDRRDYVNVPWIGVDLDGTLAEYDGWKGYEHIGAPIPAMVDRVKRWLAEGRCVKIFTARVSILWDSESNQFKEQPCALEAAKVIRGWCKRYIGAVLPITCIKDYGMIEIWDDRCKQVILNTGRVVEDCFGDGCVACPQKYRNG